MKKHVPQFDGLRGIAVLIVLLGHIAVFGVGLGITRLGPLPPLGVDLFFVLSGFLITNVLLESVCGRRYYLNFYARRALRIWPLYAILLVVIFGLANHRIPLLSFNAERIQWQYFALFVQNIVYPLPVLLGPLALAVTWSVAVEEQFYAIWPLLVRRFSQIHLAWILSLIVISAPLARYGAEVLGIDPYINPLCRFDGMALGSLVALWVCRRQPDLQSLRKASWSLLLLSAAGGAAAAVLHLQHLLGKTFVSLGFCGVLVGALAFRSMAYVLSRSWIRYVGKISYGIYLLHLPAAAVTATVLDGNGWRIRIARACIIFAGSIGAATISWYLVESRTLRLKRFFVDTQEIEVIRTNEAALEMNEPARQIV
jgi:peptidoglycan/LPS O-acetylase OafA/YrhL